MKWRQWGRQAESVIHYVEDEYIPLLNYVLGFIFVIFVRDFFESFSRHTNYFDLPSSLLATDLIHFTLSYVLLALLLIGVLHVMTRQPILKLMRVILTGFTLLWICPLLDLLIYQHGGVSLSYIQPGININKVIQLFFRFFGDFPGVSLGLRIEILMALLGIYTYCRIKKMTIIHSAVTTCLVYTTIFLWGSSPFLVQWGLRLAGFSYTFSSQLMVNFYLLVLPPVVLVIISLAAPALTFSLLKDMRYLRVMHYELMLLLGATLGLTFYHYSIMEQLRFNQGIVINLMLTMMSLLFAAAFSIMANNVADINIDKISNQTRPLVTGEISVRFYQRLQIILLGLAWFYALMVNAKAFLIISIFMGLYYVYSMPPLRFKRVTLFSKLAISINSLALVILGYVLVQSSLNGFPAVLYVIFLAGFTLAANFIDLKDVKGDQANGISTLPVVLGVKQAKRIIGAGFVATYISFYYLLPVPLLLPLFIIGGAIQYYLLNRAHYRESYVLVCHNISIFTLMSCLIWLA